MVTGIPDHYAVLQVDPAAEPEVIEAAYRRLAAKYHPDVNSSADAGERMKLLNVAHAVLSDPQLRAEYDLTRRQPAQSRLPPTARRATPARRRPSASTWVIPLALLLVVFLSPRVGSRPALIITLFVVVIAYGWLAGRRP